MSKRGKTCNRQDLAPVIRSVIPVSIGGMRGLVIELGADRTELPPCLTSAEQEIVTLALQGLSNQEIATERGTRYRTIANQLAAIYRKLGVGSRTELVALVSGISASSDGN